MLADDFLDGPDNRNSADAFLDEGTKKSEPSFKDSVYAVVNRLFRPSEASVMEGMDGATVGKHDPAAFARVNDIIARGPESVASSLPNAPRQVSGAVGIAEKALRGGFGSLAKSGLGIGQAAADLLGAESVSDTMARAAKRATDIQGGVQLDKSRIDGFTHGSIVQDLPEAAANAGSSIIANAPALVASVASGNPAAGLSVLFGQSAGQEYGDGRADGLGGGGALLRALPMAAAEVLGEKVGGFGQLSHGLRSAIKGEAPERVLRQVGGAALRDIPGEELTTLAQFGIDKLPGIGTNQEAGASELVEQLKDTALTTMLQGGAMTGGAMAANRVARSSTSAPGTTGRQELAPEVAEVVDLVPSIESAPGQGAAALADLIQSTGNIDSRNDVQSADAFLDATDDANTRKPENDLSAVADAGTIRSVASQALQPSPATDDESGTDIAVSDTRTEQPAALISTVNPDNQAISEFVDEQVPEISDNPNLPAPVKLGESALQISTPTPGLKPGDIVASDGKPFATRSAAAVPAKDAGKGWRVVKGGGGFAVRYYAPTQKQLEGGKRAARAQASINSDRDSLFAAIAKLGGINSSAVQSAWGIDPADLRNLYGAGIKRVATSKGRSIDSMAEALAEIGYLSRDQHGKHDNAEFEELFNNELGGTRHFTPEGYANEAQRHQDAEYEEYLSRQDAVDAGLDALENDAQEFVHEVLGDPQEDAAVADFLRSLEELNYDEETDARIDSRAEKTDTGSTIESAEGAAQGGYRSGNEIDRYPPETDSAGKRTPDDATDRQEDLADDFALSQESADQTRARLARESAQQKQDNQQRRADDMRAEVDAARNDFRLTGSERDADQAAANGQQGMFSRDVTGLGMTVDQVRAAISSVNVYGGIDVYQTMAEAPDYIQQQEASESGGLVDGFWDVRKNKVGLIAENISSKERAIEVVRHELIGHYGLENMLNDIGGPQEMARLVRRVMNAEKDGNKVIRDLARHVDETQPDIDAERRAKEIIAVMAERNMQNSIAKRVLDAVRKFLNKLGLIQTDTTDADIASVLRDTQKYFRAQGRAMVSGEAAAFSRAANDYAELHAFLDGTPVAEMRGDEVPKLGGMKSIVDWAADYFQQKFDSHVTSPELGEVAIDRVSAKDSLSHGYGKQKIQALYIVPEIVRNGRVLTSDSKATGLTGYVVGAPVRIGGEDYIGIALVRRDNNGQRMYVHEVVLRERLRAAFNTAASADESDELHGAKPGVIRSILQKIYNVKPDANFSRRAPDGQDELSLNETMQGPKREPIKARDFVNYKKNSQGRREYEAGRKLYERTADAANAILSKVKLADNKPDAFKKMMRQLQIDQNKAVENAKRIAEAGQTITPSERIMLSDIIEKQLGVADVPPEHIAELAAGMQATLKSQAEKLVELGMLTEDRLVENYMPRLYKNPIIARLTSPEMMRSWYAKARMKIGGARLQSRGLIDEVPLAKVAAYKKLGWRVSTLADGSEVPTDLFDALKNDASVPEAYRAPNFRVLMWRDYTEDERIKMGEVRDGVLRYALGYVETQKDIAIGRLYKAIASNSELSSVANPGGWVKIPKDDVKGSPGVRQYGALAGMFVPREVSDALKRNTQPKGLLMAAYDRALSFWKEGKTVWNPVAHGNNFVSNLFVMHFAGLNPANPVHYRNTIREFKQRGRYWNEAVDNGLFGAEFANSELRSMLMPDLEDMADIETVAASRVTKVTDFLKKYPGRPISFYRDKMQKAYEFEDQFFKMMIFMDRRNAGMSIDDAITDTERYIFNYADVPEGVELIKRAYSPFFSYTYKVMPMLLHTAMTRPDRMLAPMMLLGGANWLAYAFIGGDEDKERKGMPEYMEGRTSLGVPKSIRMPFNVDDKPAFMDISRRVPGGDLFDVQNQTGGVPIVAPFMPSHPVFSTAQALMFNQDTFTGKSLVKGSDTAWEAAEARAGYLYRQLLPNAPFLPGSYNFNKLMDGAAYSFDTEFGPYTGRTKAGDAIPLASAAADALTGTKIRAFDPDRGLDYREFELTKESKEISANIRSAMRNQSMTPGKREAYIEGQREKQRILMEKRRELRQ